MKRNTLKKILKALRGSRLLIGLSALMAGCTVAGSLLLPVQIGRAVDCIAGPGQVDLEALIPVLRRMAAVILLTALCQWVMNALNNRVVFSVTEDIRNRAFLKLQKLPVSWLDAHPSGDIVSRVIADVDAVADGLLLGFTQLFTGVLTILCTLAFMLAENLVIGLLVLVVTPLSLFVARFIAKKSHTHFAAQSKSRGAETAFVNEVIGNGKTVKAYGRERFVTERFDAINEELGRHSLKAVFFSSLVNPCTRFVNSLVYALVGLFGAFSVIRGRMSVGQLTCFLTYANQYTKPFNEISGVITEFQNALVSAERIFELIELPSEKEAEADAPVSAEKMKEKAGRVCFRHVCFSYDPAVLLIRDLSLTAEPGQHIAIVGRTGCGKTTLINLLMRFYDADSGSITVGGADVRSVERHTLRAQFGMVLQDTWLRAGTIRDNIRIGKPDAPDEEIRAAAAASHALSFILRLPDGFDTVISEDGEGLSQGQKQLICITRVMLALPPMLILDEATSSIDTRTELRIQEAFGKLMEGRTSFIVAHRLSTIRNADLILVMDHGQVAEQGTHEELLRKKGLYSELYESQFRGAAL